MAFKEPDFWDRLDISSVSAEETERSYSEVLSKAKKLEASYELRKLRAGRRRSALRVIAGIAAVVALIIVPAVSVMYVRRSLDRPVQPVTAEFREFIARKGEIRELVLPDQSRVTLNAGSTLFYPETFSDVRYVYLSGEAVFDVTASGEHPFIVKTSDVSVRVHGTRFNVSAYPDEDNVNVALCRGAVSVSPNKGDAVPVELKPDQSYRYSRIDGSSTVTSVNSSEYTGWESGNLSFHSQDIHSVARTIGRRFNVNIYVTTGKYDKAVITAKFIHGETFEEQMNAICRLVPGMKYSVSGENVYLR
ncbi:MAG: FecR family protein [Candidatus Cryptobacteroides sp.]|nr:FecR domain-containing protein [Bacteroidales bacterium]